MEKNHLLCVFNSGTYEIRIDAGLLDSPEIISDLKGFANQYAIITSDRIAELYGAALCQKLLHASLFTFPDGEKYKTRQSKELLEDQMLSKGFGRDTCLIALGGGVATDLGGFVAATYCRGIPLIMIPTSLLAMVDASIGGKTGVNAPQGKNLIGSFHQPKKILIDPHVLNTLPLKEMRNGAVEMIKHGLIADHHYFEYLETNMEKLLRLDGGVLEKAIFESCRIKKEIAGADEKSNGERELLNLGHTVGHALETVAGYEISHGEAVAIGLIVECRMSVRMGIMQQVELDRIYRLLIRTGLPLKLPDQSSLKDIVEAMAMDKKSVKRKPRFVLLEGIGKPLIIGGQACHHADPAVIEESFHDLRRH